MKYIALLLMFGIANAQTIDQPDVTDDGYDNPCDPDYMGPALCWEPSGGGGGGSDPLCGSGSIPCGETYAFLPGSFSCPETSDVCDLPYNIKMQGLSEGMRRLGCFNANGEYQKNFCEQGSTKNKWYRVNVTTTPSNRNYAVFFRITKYKSGGVDADVGIREL